MRTTAVSHAAEPTPPMMSRRSVLQPCNELSSALGHEHTSVLSHACDRRLSVSLEHEVQAFHNQVGLVLVGIESDLGKLLPHGWVDPYTD